MAITSDTLFDGRLVCRQHEQGYRFSVDAVLVAHFLQPSARGRVLDLGSGCGVIGLVLCFRYPELQVTGLELQRSLADLGTDNANANGYADRFKVQQGDLLKIREFIKPESYAAVVSNPPYRKPGTGRINRHDQAALARHELTVDMDGVVRAASFAVKNRGKTVFIYPAERLTELIATMARYRFVVKRFQPVYSYPQDSQARLVLVEGIKNGGTGVKVLPPFYIYTSQNGPYSDEMAALYSS